MKKYTLEQLKTERVKIRVETEEIYTTLMKKFEEHNISWRGGEKATSYKAFGENTLVNLCDAEGHITFGVCADGYTIITPDQIDWGEDKQTEAGQDNSPAVIAKAVKDWNAFKAFVKEIEAHGRTLTGSQLKAYMAKARKLRGGK
jgi:hypothetical protein